jgi:uncharacterized membrane protein YedE/YeeE
MFPIKGPEALVLAVVFGFAFGWLLHRARVTDYNVILNQFRLRDFTVLKVMMTAILVGGVGLLVLINLGEAKWHVRDANMLATIIGAAIFGVGMVLYGYCPGTGVAAIATGSVHALVGGIGMLIGGALYAFSFDWVKANILSVWALGKVTLPGLLNVPHLLLYGVLALVAIVLFRWVEKRGL